MIGNLRSVGWLLLLIVSAIIQVHIMQELFSFYEMSYRHVVFISCWPIIFFVSFAAVYRSLWKGWKD